VIPSKEVSSLTQQSEGPFRASLLLVHQLTTYLTNKANLANLAFPACAECRTVTALPKQVNTQLNHGNAVPANHHDAHAGYSRLANLLRSTTLELSPHSREETRMATDKQREAGRTAQVPYETVATHTQHCKNVTAQQGPPAITVVSIHETLKYGSSPCTDHAGKPSAIALSPTRQDGYTARALMYADTYHRSTAIAVTPIQGETGIITPTPPAMTRPPIYQGEADAYSPPAKKATGALQPAATTVAPTIYYQIPLYTGTPNQARTKCSATHTYRAPCTPPPVGSGSRSPTPKDHALTSNIKEMFALPTQQDRSIPPHRWK
jgi:hypothetical protein